MPSEVRKSIAALAGMGGALRGSLSLLRKLQKDEARELRRAYYARAWEADQAVRQEAARPSRSGEGSNLRSLCGAQKRSGAPCQAPAVRGGSRCRRHGGTQERPFLPEGEREAHYWTAQASQRARAYRTKHDAKK
jgi:hypothetical protein